MAWDTADDDRSTADDQLTEVDIGALTSNGSLNEYYDARQGNWFTGECAKLELRS